MLAMISKLVTASSWKLILHPHDPSNPIHDVDTRYIFICIQIDRLIQLSVCEQKEMAYYIWAYLCWIAANMYACCVSLSYDHHRCGTKVYTAVCNEQQKQYVASS